MRVSLLFPVGRSFCFLELAMEYALFLSFLCLLVRLFRSRFVTRSSLVCYLLIHNIFFLLLMTIRCHNMYEYTPHNISHCTGTSPCPTTDHNVGQSHREPPQGQPPTTTTRHRALGGGLNRGREVPR